MFIKQKPPVVIKIEKNGLADMQPKPASVKVVVSIYNEYHQFDHCRK